MSQPPDDQPLITDAVAALSAEVMRLTEQTVADLVARVQQPMSPENIWFPAVDRERLLRCRRCGLTPDIETAISARCVHCGETAFEELDRWINRKIRERIRSEVAASRSADKSGS